MTPPKDLGRFVYVQSGSYRTSKSIDAPEALETPLSSGTAEAAAPPRTEAPRDVSVPEPFAGEHPSTVATSDREIAVLMSLRRPRLVLFGGLLSDAECDELIQLSAHKVERSRTVNRDTGFMDIHVDRVSEGTFFHVNENPLVGRIDRRIAELLDWPMENGEGLQIIHYGPGGEYKPHFDYFDTADPGSAVHIQQGGNRVATLIMYLATPQSGGTTIFPDAGLEVASVKGNAVFFSYGSPTPASLTLHGGAPVTAGEKWIATKWLRTSAYK